MSELSELLGVQVSQNFMVSKTPGSLTLGSQQPKFFAEAPWCLTLLGDWGVKLPGVLDTGKSHIIPGIKEYVYLIEAKAPPPPSSLIEGTFCRQYWELQAVCITAL